MDLVADLVTVSLSLLATAVVLLTVLEARKYRSTHHRPHLYWSIGLLLVVVTLAIEVVFYVGTWSQGLIRWYLFLVAVLVGVLSMGSAELSLSVRGQRVYAIYLLGSIALCAYVILQAPQSPSILSSGVVTGYPGLEVTLVSILVTVPASVLMAASSLWAAYGQRRWRPAWTAAGIIVISVAGALYIVSLPVTLYYAEFIGIVLLFVGFGGVPSPLAQSSPARFASGGAS
jgi:hypothetical protein